jgi:Uncharacterized conserved protein
MTFPTLKTGAILQYPSRRDVDFRTEVLRFVDGSEQRVSTQRKPLRRWLVRLELLSEEEVLMLQEFFNAVQGSRGSFSFRDPWDGTEYPNCSLENDELTFEFDDESRARTELTIKEMR